VVGFVSLDAGSARKPASPSIIGRFAPKPLMHFLYGDLSSGLALNHRLLQETQAEAKMLELKTPGPARRNPANPARSGRKQR